jgi:phenylalanine ammonia-lyase
VLTAVEPSESSVVRLRGEHLTVPDVGRVADGCRVTLDLPAEARERFERSRDLVERAVAQGTLVYGVNTGFGGMSDVAVPRDQWALLQRNALLHNRAGAGEPLPERCVRAAMLLRANSHLRGASGLRWELVRRLVEFLNHGATPVVRELGSIGASGDLVPLSAIARAVTGVDPDAPVHHHGSLTTASDVLAQLGLEPLELELKEGLAMVNGTAVSTGVAACCLLDAAGLLSVTLGFHALAAQALCASTEPYDAFVQRCKPHPGQVWVSAAMRRVLGGSHFTDPRVTGDRSADAPPGLAQDRYSLRCLPQFLGPVADTIRRVAGELEVELNSANDNPLIDVDSGRILHGGNFLAQYPATGMDALRAQVALMVKHVDAQLALLFAPEFSNGLPASLVGNPVSPANMGLKALQTCGNSIMPLVGYLSAPLADRFPTHAEQFNQNINSQALGATHLARQQLRLSCQHLAIALLCALQAVELRSALVAASYDPRARLSDDTAALYDALCQLLEHRPSAGRPYCRDDGDRDFEADIETLAADLEHGGALVAGARSIGLAPPIAVGVTP